MNTGVSMSSSIVKFTIHTQVVSSLRSTLGNLACWYKYCSQVELLLTSSGGLTGLQFVYS